MQVSRRICQATEHSLKAGSMVFGSIRLITMGSRLKTTRDTSLIKQVPPGTQLTFVAMEKIRAWQVPSG